MKAKRYVTAVFSILVFLVATASAWASIIYGNIGSVSNSVTYNTVGYLNSSQRNQFQAQGFSVGGIPWTLDLILLGLGTSVPTSPVVQLYSDNSGSPGGLLDSFNSTDVLTNKNVYSFTGSYQLAANTSYWVVVSNFFASDFGPENAFGWYTEDNFIPPLEQYSSGVNYLGTAERNGSGGSWSETTNSTLSISLDA